MGRLLASLVGELPAADQELLAAYAAALRRAGYRDVPIPSKVTRRSSPDSAGASTTGNHLWAARRFLRRWGVAGWLALSVDEQVALLIDPGPTAIAAGVRRFLGWLALTGRQPFPPGLLELLEERSPATIRWVEQARLAWPALTEKLVATAHTLGYRTAMINRVCHTVARTAAHTRKPPETLTLVDIDRVSEALERWHVSARIHQSQPCPLHWRQPLWPLATGTVLYHAGLVPAPPVERSPSPSPQHRGPSQRRGPSERKTLLDTVVHGWPALHAVAARYLAQRQTTLRPSTIHSDAVALGNFLHWLNQHHPDVTDLRQIDRRAHVEPYLQWVYGRADAAGQRPDEIWSRGTCHHHLACLRRFFQSIRSWEWPEAPRTSLFHPGDVPRPATPLPRAFDDVEAARMIQIARHATDPLVRLVIEVLASCGLRIGEARDLTLSDIVTFGGLPGPSETQSWLRVPLGKLGNDRYVPIGGELRSALDAYLATEHVHPSRRHSDTSPEVSSFLLLRKGRRISEHYCNRVVHRIAEQAGVTNAHAHRWRHTFATQAINRGMDLATIATLLGHTRLEMTMVYARIANSKLRQEFERVSQQVQAFYATVAADPPDVDTPVVLPVGAVGPAMTVTRREIEWRRLGNGWCTRRAYLDCRHELVCERCVHFNTDRLFLPVLEAQHADASRKGQQARVEMFTKLITAVEAAGSSGEALPVVSGPRVADFSNPKVDPKSGILA